MIKQTIGMRFAMMFRYLELPSLEREEGQTLAEYALILALIAVVVVAAVVVLQGKITDLFNTVSSSI